MRISKEHSHAIHSVVLSMCVLGEAAVVSADDRPIDCNRRSLAEAVNDGRGRGHGSVCRSTRVPKVN